jgi:hypothetical protein
VACLAEEVLQGEATRLILEQRGRLLPQGQEQSLLGVSFLQVTQYHVAHGQIVLSSG